MRHAQEAQRESVHMLGLGKRKGETQLFSESWDPSKHSKRDPGPWGDINTYIAHTPQRHQ